MQFSLRSKLSSTATGTYSVNRKMSNFLDKEVKPIGIFFPLSVVFQGKIAKSVHGNLRFRQIIMV
jgi:hypothetical protein